MKLFINLLKVFLLLNITTFACYLPLAYVGYYVGFGLAMILIIIASGVSGFYVFFQITKIFSKAQGRGILGFITGMVFTLMAWYFLYSFIVLQQGKITPLINPSEAHKYESYTFFYLKDPQYDTKTIAYYQNVHRNKEGSPSYTNYYACPIIDSNDTKNNSILWLGYDKSGRIHNQDFFLNKAQTKYEYFAKYTIEQGSFRKAIRTKISKEESTQSIVVYGIESPTKAKEEAWNYYIYFLIMTNIVFWILWVIIFFYDIKSKNKQSST